MAYRIRTVAVLGVVLFWGTQSCVSDDDDDGASVAGAGRGGVAAVGGQPLAGAPIGGRNGPQPKPPLGGLGGAGAPAGGGGASGGAESKAGEGGAAPTFTDPEVCPVADSSFATCATSLGGAGGQAWFDPELGAGGHEAQPYCHDFEDGLQGTWLVARALDKDLRWVEPPVGYAVPTLHPSNRQHVSGTYSVAVVFTGQPSGLPIDGGAGGAGGEPAIASRFRMQTHVVFGEDDVFDGTNHTAVHVLGCGPSFDSAEEVSVVADQFGEVSVHANVSCQSLGHAQDLDLTPGAWSSASFDGTGCNFELRITTWSDFVGTIYIDDVSN